MAEVQKLVGELGEAYVALVRALADGDLKYPQEVYRVSGALGDIGYRMPHVLQMLEESVDRMHARGALISDYRGRPVQDSLHDFKEGLATAQQSVGPLAAGLREAHKAIGNVGYGADD